MRSLEAMIGVAVSVTTVSVFGVATGTPPATASNYGFELNGTYNVLSNGEWAKSNEVYRPEAVKRDVWKMSSSCENTNTCEGQITSLNEGWTIPLMFRNDHWIAPRDIPNWAQCESGSAATGHQLFWFYGVDEAGLNNRSTEILAGKETTFTDSGSCGKNLGLTIELPLRITRAS